MNLPLRTVFRQGVGAVFVVDLTPGNRRVECADKTQFRMRFQNVSIVFVEGVQRARGDVVLLIGFEIRDNARALVAVHGFKVMLVPHLKLKPRREDCLVHREAHTVASEQKTITGPAIGANDLTVCALEIVKSYDFHAVASIVFFLLNH